MVLLHAPSGTGLPPHWMLLLLVVALLVVLITGGVLAVDAALARLSEP